MSILHLSYSAKQKAAVVEVGDESLCWSCTTEIGLLRIIDPWFTVIQSVKWGEKRQNKKDKLKINIVSKRKKSFRVNVRKN